MDAGPRGFRTRQLLGEWYQQQVRLAEAELQWRAAVAEQDFVPSWQALGQLYLQQQRWPEVEQVAHRLDEGNTVPAALLRARALVARKELVQARWLLEGTVGREPQALGRLLPAPCPRGYHRVSRPPCRKVSLRASSDCGREKLGRGSVDRAKLKSRLGASTKRTGYSIGI